MTYCKLYLAHVAYMYSMHHCRWLSKYPQKWTSGDVQVFDSLQRAGIGSSPYLCKPPPVMESGSPVWGSRAAGLSLALSLGEMCRWTRNKSIFRARHMLAEVHSRPWAVRLQHQMNCVGMGEGKASEWVWCSNCYHTWQCLVWDPVVHAAYVSGWSSVRQSDRVWRVTRHIRSCQRMCLTDHRNLPNALPPFISSDLFDSSKINSGVLFIEYCIYWNFILDFATT